VGDLDLVMDIADAGQLGDRQCGRVALPAGRGNSTAGQYPPQDLIPGNIDDGFRHRDDESVLGVRATRVRLGGEVRLLMIAAPGSGKGTQHPRRAANLTTKSRIQARMKAPATRRRSSGGA
jgi:hypothetical protein